VVLALDAGVLDHASCVGLQTRHGAANVAVDFDNLLDGAGLEEGGGDALFYAEDYAFAGRYLGGCEYVVCGKVGERMGKVDVRLSLLNRA
jgi:hypothetical protein